MAKRVAVPIGELDSATIERLGLARIKQIYTADQPLEPKYVALGKAWKALAPLTQGDARWVCREVLKHLLGREETRGGRRSRKEQAAGEER